MYHKEKTNVEDLIEKFALKIKQAESITDKYYNKRVYTVKYYENMAEILLDYFLTQTSPSQLAEFKKLREKGYV
jgi:hypothetical protein